MTKSPFDGRGPVSEDPLPDGGAAAMAWLHRSTAARPLTVAEARDKLRAKGHDDEVVDAVVRRAVDGGLLDDAGFAQAWVQDRGVSRGYGRDRLVRELRRRKVDLEAAEVALGAMDDVDVVAQATAFARTRAQRMPADLDPRKVAARLVGALQRRGYSSDVAISVAKAVTATDRDWD
jgi:regulatory protein